MMGIGLFRRNLELLEQQKQQNPTPTTQTPKKPATKRKTAIKKEVEQVEQPTN